MSILAYGGPVITSEDLAALIAVIGAFSTAVIAIVFTTLKNVLRTRAREQTKREIAAYVAEGSIRPEDAERIIKADLKPGERLC
jgi:hypothetical protein